MPELELKRFTFEAEVKAAEPELGVVEAIVSVFGITDRGRDRMCQGFFVKSLKAKLPKGVWMHDWTQPIAKTLVAKELPPNHPLLPDKIKKYGGLYIKGQFNLETQRGREAYSDLKFGIVDEFSIGFRVIKEQWNSEEKVRDLLEGELFEWSPVLVGMNQLTETISVKSELGQESKSKATTVGEILQAKIHQGFTVAADEIAIRGYLSTEERIAISKAISVSLETFRGALDPAVASREIEAGDVDWIASKTVSLDDEALNALTFDDHSNSVLTAVRGLHKRLADLKDLREAKGRPLSDARRGEIEGLKSLLEDLLTSTTPDPLTKTVLELRREAAVLDASLMPAL